MTHNALTTIRDLVYQNKFTESLRLAYSNPTDKTLSKEYVKAHSEVKKINRKKFWLDCGNGVDQGYTWAGHQSLIYGYGSGWGNGLLEGYSSGSYIRSPWRKYIQ